jgi:hypothetical protein
MPVAVVAQERCCSSNLFLKARAEAVLSLQRAHSGEGLICDTMHTLPVPSRNWYYFVFELSFPFQRLVQRLFFPQHGGSRFLLNVGTYSIYNPKDHNLIQLCSTVADHSDSVV